MGRPTKLDDLTSERLIQAVRKGLSQRIACRLSGITVETLHNWRQRAENDEEPFFSFFERMARAEAERAVEAIERVSKAGKEGTWQAETWWLSRHFPTVYGEPRVAEVVTPAAAKPVDEDGADAYLEALTSAHASRRRSA